MLLINHIKEFCKVNYNFIRTDFDEIEIEVNKENLLEIITFLKDDHTCLFEQLSDLTAIDYPNKNKRFLIIYQFLSVTNNNRIRVLCPISENDTIPSISKIYPSAIWAEREVWDMFGIFIDDHPDLRRILTDYGFQGHPLRKDFPLTGHLEVNYDLDERRVVYNPVSLVQDFRDFDFSSPWGVQIANKSNKTDEKK